MTISRATVSVDLRRLESYMTGTGRTIAESLSLLRDGDELVVRAVNEECRLAQRRRASSSVAVALEGLRRQTIGPRVWQPWLLGPLGSERTLLGVYDLIPLRLGVFKSAVLRRRLSVVRRDPTIAVLTLLNGTRQRLVHDYGIAAARVHVVSPGIDRMAKPERSELMRTDKPYALVVARYSPHKNLDVLLKGWFASGKAIDLTMVLPPHDASGAFGQSAANAGVRILSGLSAADLGRFTAHARCVVSPSLEEGFGLPAVEAAAAGTALFMSDIDAYREVQVDDAVLVSPCDVDAWARTFRRAAAGELKPATLRPDAPTWDTWRRELDRLLDSLRTG